MSTRLLCFLLVIPLLAGCLPGPEAFSGDRWQYADLRIFDPPDGADPQLDLIAAYARCTDAILDVRLDLLESVDPWAYDLYLAVDTQPGGSRNLPIAGSVDLEWDLWIELQAGEPVEVVFTGADQGASVAPLAWRNTRLDTVEVRLPFAGHCPARARLQAFLTPAGVEAVADATEVFPLDGAPPRRAPLLLAFWDTLPGITPAQALRRWNGAHTGPYGQRHGLAVLLEAVDTVRVPVALLDLTRNSSLPALEAVGGIAWIRDLSGQGLLTLPEVETSAPPAAQVALSFTLPASQLVFDPASFDLRTPAGRSIPLPSRPQGEERQADEHGLTLASKRALLAAALSPGTPPTVSLGGSLPQSEWAEAEIARPALEYIAAHPWIQPLSAHDLAAWPGSFRFDRPVQAGSPSWLCADGATLRGFDAFGQPLPQTAADVRRRLAEQLHALPEGEFTKQAWQAWESLTQPAASCEQATIQANYLGEIGYLIAAAKWSQNPANESSCSQDIDFDGQPECVLAGPSAFAVIEPDGARLAFAALGIGASAFQIVGLQSQFGVGISDPSAWHLERGPRADPYVHSGAFDDERFLESPYTWEISAVEMRFTHPDTGVTKSYRLTTDGFQVKILFSATQDYSIPLIVAPVERFRPNWTAQYRAGRSAQENVVQWGLPEARQVVIEIDNAAFDLISFRDSAAALHQVEDPDREYPEGHYLPFPMALLTIHADGDLTVSFRPSVIQ